MYRTVKGGRAYSVATIEGEFGGTKRASDTLIVPLGEEFGRRRIENIVVGFPGHP